MKLLTLAVSTCHKCPRRSGDICTVGQRPFLEFARPYECPESRFPSRGLGDVVAKAIRVTTGGLVKPCQPCNRRKEKLNQLFSFTPPEPSPGAGPPDSGA